MAETLRTPRGSDGACLFLKSGSACRRLGSSEATQGGGPRRKEGALLRPEAEWELGKWCCSAGGRGLQAVRPARGPRATMQAVAAALHTLGLRRPTSAACGAAGAGAWAAVARLRLARTARPQLPVQLSLVVFVQLRSSIVARPPRRGRGWKPSLVSLPRVPATGGPRLLLLRAREKRGDRRDPLACRTGEARREAREPRELREGAPSLSSVWGAGSARGLCGDRPAEGCGGWGQGTGASAGEA